MSVPLEGSVLLNLDERPGRPGLYATHMKVTVDYGSPQTLLGFAARCMERGEMQAEHFNAMLMQAFKAIGVYKIRDVALVPRVKGGRQNAARLLIDVYHEDGHVYRTTVDPRLHGPEVLTRNSPAPGTNGVEQRPQREYITNAVSRALSLIITEMAQCRRSA